ncbi:MAG: hypothetical protein WC860_05210 [Candidatus Margulisiibacteriota bacterium]|jgi:hypothetical protein
MRKYFSWFLNYYIYIIGIIVLCIFAWLNSNVLNLSIMHSDDYVRYYDLITLYKAILTKSWKLLVPDVGYGYPFTIINFFAALPFLIINNEQLILFFPRFVLSFFAAGSLFIIYKILKRDQIKITSKSNISILFCILIICFMPAFFSQGLKIYPQHLMGFFILLSSFLLIKDNFEFKKYYWLSSIFAGIAISIKIEAIFYLLTYIFYSFAFLYLNKFNFKSIIKAFLSLITTMFISFAIFVVLNPYLLTSLGREKWYAAFLVGKYNCTIKITLLQKIFKVIGGNYYNPILYLIVIISLLWNFFSCYRKKEFNFYSYLSPFIVFSQFYMLLTVNKNWPNYYLVSMMLSVIGIFSILKLLEKKTLYYIIFVIFILCLQIIPIKNTISIFVGRYNDLAVFERSTGQLVKKDKLLLFAKNQAIQIKPYIKDVIAKKDSQIFLMSAWTNFDFISIGIPYIREIYSPLLPDLYLSKKTFRHNIPPVEIIILKKTEYYFNDMPVSPEEQKSRLLVRSWLRNNNGDFVLVKKTDYLYVFKKNPKRKNR